MERGGSDGGYRGKRGEGGGSEGSRRVHRHRGGCGRRETVFESGRRDVVEGVTRRASGTAGRGVESARREESLNVLSFEPICAETGTRNDVGVQAVGIAVVSLHHVSQRRRGGDGVVVEPLAWAEGDRLAEGIGLRAKLSRPGPGGGKLDRAG